MIAFLACAALMSEYQLVWSDEFDVDGAPDPKKWVCEEGFVRNNELQVYQKDNVVVKNGLLTIEARREKTKNPFFKADLADPNSKYAWKLNKEFGDYSSGSVNTKGLASWQYARIEVKARIDVRNGLWPAMWTKGVDRAWPDCGEVDVLEFQKGSLVRSNIIWGEGPTTISTKLPLSQFVDRDDKWADKFHVWREDWDADSISIYLDDALQSKWDLTKTLNADGFNPFHQPHFLLLNMAVGSTGGDPSSTTLPGKYEIDYVRVYQRPPASR